jgi:hypothetical protein
LNQELYFITILQKAFEVDDITPALTKAIGDIIQLGRGKGYREGFDNFQMFIKEIYQCYRLFEKDYIAQIVPESIYSQADQVKETDVKHMTDSLWLEQYHPFQRIVSDLKVITPTIDIFFDGRLIGSISLDKNNKSQRFSKISPGDYTVKLSTGRIIWKGTLAAEELIINKTFGSEHIKLAADTEGPKVKPVRVINIVAGKMCLKIFAGLNNGSIEVELN